MTKPLVECIPNFSEARRPEVVDAIVQAIDSVPGIHVLDRQSDLDHNRSVITFIGEPQPVEDAAFQAIKTAAQLIDLNQHQGEHPRVGATDVVPFVPISDITMPECVEMARRLGKRVGDELKIPVYLYEEAATRPERQNLENIRHGQYEALKEEIGTLPERRPDFGPAQVGPAGATVVGARHPLIAFNVYLTTDDVSVAQKIARAVRNSSGGMHYVKALGLLVDGRAQVSMNLTNYHQSPVARVVELVRREAERYGASIHHTELVGLTPQDSLIDAAQWYLQLDAFQPDQILESRLYEVMSEGRTEASPGADTGFLDALAAGTATPGGGSAAAHTGAVAAALVAMVARLTIGKKKYATVEGRMWEIVEAAEAQRTQLSHAVELDSAAFEDLMVAMRLPKDAPEQQQARDDAVERASIHASEVPLEVAGQCTRTMTLAVEIAGVGNANAITDAATAALLAYAAMTSARLNVLTNIRSLRDREAAAHFHARLDELDDQARHLEALLKRHLAERGGLPV